MIMKELALKYGCNPNQKPSRIFMEGDRELPITVLSGRPGYELKALFGGDRFRGRFRCCFGRCFRGYRCKRGLRGLWLRLSRGRTAPR